MSRARHASVSDPVKMFVAQFMAKNNGRRPTATQVIKGLPELEGKKHAIVKVLQRIRDKKPEEFAPIIPIREGVEFTERPSDPATTLEHRLTRVRWLLTTIEETVEAGGRIDATGYDRLTRLERDLQKWIAMDGAEDTAETEGSFGSIEAIMMRYKERQELGLNAKRSA